MRKKLRRLKNPSKRLRMPEILNVHIQYVNPPVYDGDKLSKYFLDEPGQWETKEPLKIMIW
jgi:hypothetical protein